MRRPEPLPSSCAVAETIETCYRPQPVSRVNARLTVERMSTRRRVETFRDSLGEESVMRVVLSEVRWS